ncbi:MAG TPA: phosphoribosylformylglycinamidine synthase, partial [Thiothrix sp.]|nr:phosphoribosylformylglycinamidine synthase [Thiothrix sp.]
HHSDTEDVLSILREAGLAKHSHVIGQLNYDDEIRFSWADETVYAASRVTLQQYWAETSYRMQALRDNETCAQQEFESIATPNNRGIPVDLSFDINENIAAPYINHTRPSVAILREQGVNGQQEMAAAFNKAGFRAVDVHMTDIIDGRITFDGFSGVVACGGFSYGDVLGAGGGWAKSILLNSQVTETFSAFFARDDVFALGVCNGCQMFSQIKDIIPNAEHWPRFHRNFSEQFEARLSTVEVMKSPSIFLQGMEGSLLPVAVSHGEGRAVFAEQGHDVQAVVDTGTVSLRYVDHAGKVAEDYPYNPNGSPAGITGLTTESGQFTIMMPHPERLFRSVQYSWKPDEWGEDGAWMRMFRNARVFVD